MTAVAGAIYTAAQFNTYTRDNLNELRLTPQNRCNVFHSTTQVVTSGNTTALNLDSEFGDNTGMHDTVTNNNRVTVLSGQGGTYLVMASTQVENTGAAPAALLHLRLNGTTFASARVVTDAALVLQPTRLNVFFITNQLSATDYLDLAGEAVTANVTFGSATSALATRLQVIGPMPPT